VTATVLLEAPTAAEWLAARREGLRVGVAVGCFDLLHVGHARLLADARRAVDLVVVALNTDASVRALKGEGRPLVPLEERAELLAELRTVDLVTSFEGTTAHELLEALRPEALLKGTDRTPETVPERELVERLGGEVLFLGDPKEHASSALAARLESPAADGR
jgi:rfaE bifunctional protein nucleotidyltransferase chain/domain